MEAIITFLTDTLNIVKDQLDDESIEAVTHYLSHDEPEMAFEGLFLEIMNLDSHIDLDWERCKSVGMELNLHEESVFDFGFWSKFESFIGQRVN